MKFRIIEKEETLASAYTVNGEWYDVGGSGVDSFSVQIDADVATPAAVIVASAAITLATNTWASTAHGLKTGLKVQLTTSSALPDPLLVLTDYFVIVVDANSFKLASTLPLAIAGTPISLVDVGTGNQTVTPVALAGASVKLQQSNDPASSKDASDLGSATNVTVDAVIFLEKDRPTSRWVRWVLTLTAGYVSAVGHVLGKGDKD
jgi:hypothetical protein